MEKEYICEIKREIGDFNVIKFPIEFWKDLNNLQLGNVKLIISQK